MTVRKRTCASPRGRTLCPGGSRSTKSLPRAQLVARMELMVVEGMRREPAAPR